MRRLLLAFEQAKAGRRGSLEYIRIEAAILNKAALTGFVAHNANGVLQRVTKAASQSRADEFREARILKGAEPEAIVRYINSGEIVWLHLLVLPRSHYELHPLVARQGENYRGSLNFF